MICLYLYQYLLLWDVSHIVGNGLMSTSQRKFNCANPFSRSWDISQQSFYSYWWPNISVICCHCCTSCICADSPHLGLSSATWFVKISPLVVEIQAEWSLWHQHCRLLSPSINCIWQNVIYHLTSVHFLLFWHRLHFIMIFC